MKKLILLTLATLFIMTAAQAQSEETLFDNNRLSLSGFWFSATHQFAYHEDDFALLRGGYFGFEFNRSLLLGWGRFNYRDIVPISDVQTQYEMKFDGFSIGLTPQSHKAVHPRINFLAGGGKIRLDDGNSDRVVVLQPSAGVELNVFRWFRLGVEGGYRFVSDTDFPNLDGSDFSAPFAQIDLKFGWSWGGW